MINARALLSALIGMGVPTGQMPPMNALPQFAPTGKKRRKVDHLRIRAKELHHGYPGAKLARKAFLGEVGTARPR